MKNIIIAKHNTERINNMIVLAEGRARVRKITVAFISATVKDIEDKLNALNISKKSREGFRVKAEIHNEIFPNAYQYTPEGTGVTLIYKLGKWRIESTYRTECNQKRRFYATFTDAMKEEIERNYLETI